MTTSFAIVIAIIVVVAVLFALATRSKGTKLQGPPSAGSKAPSLPQPSRRSGGPTDGDGAGRSTSATKEAIPGAAAGAGEKPASENVGRAPSALPAAPSAPPEAARPPSSIPPPSKRDLAALRKGLAA
ncbi:MAG: hypothetical protein ACREJ3_05700, partial [Polyangiaceae bacterium]